LRRPTRPTLFPYTTLFRSDRRHAEEDLLSRMQEGYKLETDSLGGNPTLRRLKDNEVIRALSANRNTIKALEQRGFISPAKVRELDRKSTRLNSSHLGISYA